MSKEMMIKVGIVKEAVNEGAIRNLKKMKTSMVNIRVIVKLEKQINDEMKIYQESINEYIMQNGTGEGNESKIDTSNPIIRNAYIAHVLELRESDTDIIKMSKPMFSEKDFETKGIELSAEEVMIFNGLGITNIDLGLDDKESEEESDKESDEDIEKEEIPEEKE